MPRPPPLVLQFVSTDRGRAEQNRAGAVRVSGKKVTLAAPDEECSYEEMFVYIRAGSWRAAMAAERSLKTSGCDEMPFV